MIQISRHSYFAFAGLVVFAGTLAAGCSSPEQSAPPTPAATVGRPLEYDVVEWDEYPARLESPQVVSLSARVSGVIERVPFEDGSLVQAGDVLFVIDQRPFLADLHSKEADLSKAQSQLTQAEAHFKRYEKLKGTRAIAAEDYDQALANLLRARSDVSVADAAVRVSKLNLEWTTVTAPISGRVSRKRVTEGNLVTGGSGQATQLTTITSIDPIYCYANIPERAFLEYQALGDTTRQDNKVSGGRVPAWIKLQTETGYNRRGFIDFIDNRIDRTTGTVEIRAVIPNPDGRLAPGLFARMRIPGSDPYRALLLPDAAIGTTQDSRFILVVGKENTVEQRPVQAGALFGTLRAITQGVNSSDLVVVNGIQQLRPGTKVTVNEVPVQGGEVLAQFAPPTASAAPPAKEMNGAATAQDTSPHPAALPSAAQPTETIPSETPPSHTQLSHTQGTR